MNPTPDFAVRSQRERDHRFPSRVRGRAHCVPAVIDGREIVTPATGTSSDPSQPDAPMYSYVEASAADVDAAVEVAAACRVIWGTSFWRTSPRGIAGGRRSDASGARHDDRDDGDTTPAAPCERPTRRYPKRSTSPVTYGDCAADLDRVVATRTVRFTPEGWWSWRRRGTFPYSIPAGGVLAALAAGNAVILKPAPESGAHGIRARDAMLARRCAA
jgi:RHH-type proline utilization regulon transcriptional repressor/proline dehydrogenase/delta 1-pyrroline-5-carboxylate dehydrogenase